MTTLLILGLLVVIAVVIIVLYNGLVRLVKQVDNGWSQISVQLQRRHDLIPNLVETVKGYAAHEQETMTAVIEARNAAVSANGSGVQQAAQAEGLLTGALSKLFALSEAYPDLKANTNFLKLQEELTSTEDRVSYARQFYNDSVTKLNTAISTFPGLIIAKFGSFKERELFEAEAAASVVPTVKF
jgi:LemA protein